MSCWVAWKWEAREGKATKPPINPHTGGYADTSDPRTWGTFEEALAHCKKNPTTYAGIGFVFAGGVVGVDLDKCRDPQTGELEEWARALVARIDSYTEISPSGKGLHILIPGSLPGKSRRKGQIEVYDRGRYFTVTGNVLEGIAPSLNPHSQEILNELYGEIFGIESLSPQTNGKALPARAPVSTEGIEGVLRKMFASKVGARIEKLWHGDWSEDYASGSEADLALMSHLAFWCNGDRELMREMFSVSVLGSREKWKRRDYQDRTIEKALEGTAKIGDMEPETTSLESLIGVPITPMRELIPLVDQKIEYLLTDLIPKGALVMLQGQPKGGKSVFALFLAMELSLGEWKAGLFEATRPTKVLLMEYEDAAILVAKRLSKYLVGADHGAKEFPENLFFSDFPEFYVDAEKYCSAMIEYIKKNSIDLLILDTLSHVHRAENENQASDMKPAMAALKRITKKTGATVLVIHHVAKGSGERNISEKGRGSSTIPGAADVIIDWGDRKGTNTTPVSVVSKFGDSINFSVDYVPLSDGSVQFEILKDENLDWRDKIESTYQEIKASFVTFPTGIPMSELKKKLPKISDRQVDRYVNKLEKDGRVSIRKQKTDKGMVNFVAIIV